MAQPQQQGGDPTASAAPAWYDKYRVPPAPGAPPTFDFSRLDVLPPADAAAVAAAEAAAAAARPAALAAARRAKNGAAPGGADDEPRHVVLSSGARMPLLGLGTWKAPPGAVRAAVAAALRAGYRHVDCAAVYQNEGEVGAALEAALAEGAVRRAELFVTSKLWNSAHGAAGARAACLRSLRALRLEYLDLYLIHWPASGSRGAAVQPPLAETWAALEALVDDGLVRSIGVSNFSSVKLGALMARARIAPAVCQVECHPFHRNDALLAWCRSRGVHVTAYSPLGSPDSAALFKRAAPSLLGDATVAAVAARAGRSPAQVLVRWALQRGTSVLPKSSDAGRIAANADVWGWRLGDADFEALSSLAHRQRMVAGDFLLSPEGPYRTLAELWDEDEEEEQGAREAHAGGHL